MGVGLAKVFIQGSFEKKKNNIYISHHLQRTKEERDTETLWMHTQVELKKKSKAKVIPHNFRIAYEFEYIYPKFFPTSELANLVSFFQFKSLV